MLGEVKPLTVFLSSTCYDLRDARSAMSERLAQAGFDVVRSEEHDVLYDPSLHTHSSCLVDVAEADVLINVIGGRFGGTTVPDTAPFLDAIGRTERDMAELIAGSQVSVTQAEVLTAIALEIPIFTLVRNDIWQDRTSYLRDQNSNTLGNYPSVDKQDAAPFIFDFVSFLQRRPRDNKIIVFEDIYAAIVDVVRQMSGLFRRCLLERRYNGPAIDMLREELDLSDPIMAKALDVCDAFLDAGIECALGGSIARAFYGGSAPSRDIDVQVYVTPTDVARVVPVIEALGMTHSYSDVETYAASEGQVRLDWSGTSVDLFMLSDPFHESCRDRRQWREFSAGRGAFIMSPEDACVMFLFLNRQRAAMETARYCGDRFDDDYVARWCTALGIDYQS